ncbi:hypothetical protein OBBRIDRAFT_807788 [Obba rivulosa]|uniref:Uncharacterized protein n=1 Tax=Obba rivulosa TaxID=1052685 RepID=A0A8E2ATM5_9APHY|nr:hypothetical protein OBBRIDRAFT_807788 [Obba rivulosa]
MAELRIDGGLDLSTFTPVQRLQSEACFCVMFGHPCGPANNSQPSLRLLCHMQSRAPHAGSEDDTALLLRQLTDEVVGALNGSRSFLLHCQLVRQRGIFQNFDCCGSMLTPETSRQHMSQILTTLGRSLLEACYLASSVYVDIARRRRLSWP